MRITSSFSLDTLSSRAQASPRLRQNCDLRNTPEDNSQLMLNALELGTVIFEAKDGRYEPIQDEDILRVTEVGK